ncbi:hypothetical protein AcdelDRAFT_0109 [Acidovorax delafieldii 2AN]|jgi:hypothetical protein|uniref:Uncharacterized protein n=1 Tax=Acidovorax delafieldii 2AN TaxID=573060 RepID=C5SZM9_ACIDE|nr:hypothetical protein [Acidovorax delafieldii]EER62425.1 hypothetical protein AcdelDRAFT_0109 [Acidovorax delafieldii 2AN]
MPTKRFWRLLVIILLTLWLLFGTGDTGRDALNEAGSLSQPRLSGPGFFEGFLVNSGRAALATRRQDPSLIEYHGAFCEGEDMGEIADNAVMLITQKSYPNTYAAWGEKGIECINALMQPAAEIVASSPGCDRLEVLELSNQRSSPPDNIVFFADCANGNRFYITESEILAKRKTVSQNDKAKWLDEQQLLEISQEAVRTRVKGSCSFTGGSVYRAVVGRTVVTVEFEVMNDAGTTAVAKCYFDGLSLAEVELSLR